MMIRSVSPRFDGALGIVNEPVPSHRISVGYVRYVRRVLVGLLMALGAWCCGTPALSAVTGVEEVVFAARQVGSDGHWYANFGYYAFDENDKLYRAGGRLCRLNLKTGKLTMLLEDPEGSVRDPQVHYDAQKILFSYRRVGSDHFHLYEINCDGTGMRQLTSGPYDDIEPTYLPDGRIMFCSSRCNR
ncbi:MAG: TolB family protein, partial [Planctomycetota bacterium]